MQTIDCYFVRLFPREKYPNYKTRLSLLHMSTVEEHVSRNAFVASYRLQNLAPQFTRNTFDNAVYVYSLQSSHTSTYQIKSEEVRLLFSYLCYT